MMPMIDAKDVKPGSFIKVDGNAYTVRYCYYQHEAQEVRFDLEKGQVKLSSYIDNTTRSITCAFSDDIFVIEK